MSQNVGQTDGTLARVRALAQAVAAAQGTDLVDVSWTTEAGHRTLRVTIERAALARSGADATVGWGVSLDDCADFSRSLSQALDLEDVVPGAFNLEVSSPGLDRPLFSAGDYRRFVGQPAKVKLTRPAPDGQRVLRGELASVEVSDGREHVTVVVDGKPIRVPFADVAEGHLVFELQAAARPGKSPGKSAGKSAGKAPGKSAGGGPGPKKGPKAAARPESAKKSVSGGGAAAASATVRERSLGSKANVRSES